MSFAGEAPVPMTWSVSPARELEDEAVAAGAADSVKKVGSSWGGVSTDMVSSQ